MVVVLIALVDLRAGVLPAGNLLNVARQSAIVGVIAIGMTFVILTGGIDLSVGSVLALSGVTMAMLINQRLAHRPRYPVRPDRGHLVGLLTGLGVAVLGIQPFIVTLATTVAIRGVSLR